MREYPYWVVQCRNGETDAMYLAFLPSPELTQVSHAATLEGIPLREYVMRAVAQRMGVGLTPEYRFSDPRDAVGKQKEGR